MDKDMKIVVKAAEKRGWRLKSGNKHYVLVHPNGARVHVSRSPSDRNAYRQLERRLRYKEREVCSS